MLVCAVTADALVLEQQTISICDTDSLTIAPKQKKNCQSFNTLRSEQNGRHFATDTFRYIFLHGNVSILIMILLNFVPKGPIDNIPSIGSDNGLVQACRHQDIIWVNDG